MIRAGSSNHFEVLWDRNPDLVFRALVEGGNIPAQEPGNIYRMLIARELPHMAVCTREVFDEQPG
jgi:hypothetical protein